MLLIFLLLQLHDLEIKLYKTSEIVEYSVVLKDMRYNIWFMDSSDILHYHPLGRGPCLLYTSDAADD